MNDAPVGSSRPPAARFRSRTKMGIELSLRRPEPRGGLDVGRSAMDPRVLMWSEAKELRYDPTSTGDAGGSPDPELFTGHHATVPARCFRVRQTLPQAT